jgi:hypothetical protein
MYPRYFFLFMFLLFVRIAFSQDLTKKITITVHDQPLDEVIKQIGETGKIYFSYNSQTIPTGLKITLQAVDRTIKEVLDEILTKNGIEYFIIEDQVVLKMKNPEDLNHPGKIMPETRRFTISGYIREKSTGEVLIGANVYLKGTSVGTTTNAYGYYSLTVPEGDYLFVFSFIGFQTETRQLSLDGSKSITVDLEKANVEISEVEIIESNKESDLRNNYLSEIKLSPKQLNQLPGFVGDVDVIKALQVIPGIKSFGDGSAFFYVRGGGSDQNLLLIDEAPIYNPSHLFGFVSALAPDAINDVEAYKGDFPANYGDRLSSVIDIKSKDGNMKRFGFSGNIGPYASNLSLEGPIIKDKSSFFISGRKSTLSWLRNINTALKTFDITFFDINAKLNLKVNNNNRLFLTLYWGEDMLNRNTDVALQTYGISWNNIVGTFRWNHVFSPRLFSNTTVYYSRYNYYLFTSKKLNDFWNSSINHATFKTDFTYFLNPKNTLKSGIEVSYHFSNPGNVTNSDTASQNNAPVVPKYRSMEYVIYVSNEQRIGRKFNLRYGLRLPVWQDIGPTTVYYFNTLHQVSDTLAVGKNSTYATFISPEPRILIQYHFTKALAVKASYSRTTQFIQVLSNSTSPFTSLEVWAPSGPNIQPQKADQYVLGFYTKLFGSKLNFSSEIYYKQFYNHIDYKDHASMLYNPLIEGELRFGKAWSYGIELMLSKPEGKITGWIGYTYARAIIQTPEVNSGKSYPAYYDRPNDFCIYLSYNTYKHWAFSVNWMLISGAAITTPTGFYYYNGYSVPIYGDKNNDRLPVYHRLDLSVTYNINKPGNRFQHSLVLTLYNAYGRYNPFSVDFNKIMAGDGEFVVPSNLNGSYELVPTTISVAGIIPSVNYIFKF